jgi:hypothetical protein
MAFIARVTHEERSLMLHLNGSCAPTQQRITIGAQVGVCSDSRSR